MKPNLPNILTALLTALIIGGFSFFVSVKVSEGVTEQKFHNVSDRLNDIVSRLQRIENKIDGK
jgi:hypothetical protein